MDLTAIHPGLAGIIVAGAIVTALYSLHRYAVRPVVQVALEVRELLRDLRGYPGRPGYPARPGLVEAVTAQERTMAEHLVWSAALDHRFTEHLVWSEEITEQIQAAIANVTAAVDRHLSESERTRRAGHQEATKMWAALEALAPRDPTLRTRRDDDTTEETP
jgi:hypothetical protein